MSVGPSNRRRDVRRSMPPLAVRIGDTVFRTVNWSLGGLALAEAGALAAEAPIGTEVRGHFGPDEKHLPCPFRAVVVRIEAETGVVAVHIIELPSESFTFLERLLRHAEPLPAPVPAAAEATAAAPPPTPPGEPPGGAGGE